MQIKINVIFNTVMNFKVTIKNVISVLSLYC